MEHKAIRLIFVGTFFLLFIFIIFLMFSRSNQSVTINPSVQVPTPLPTQIVVPSVNESLKEIIRAKTPYITPTFTIEYLALSETFLVTITQSPYEENKIKAEAWFREQGVTNLSQLKITYYKYKYVQ